MVMKTGIPEAQIKTRVVDGSRDAAINILKEARGGDYVTIVLGKNINTIQYDEYDNKQMNHFNFKPFISGVKRVPPSINKHTNNKILVQT